MKKTLSNSTRKFIRRRKAEIRSQFLDSKKRQELIQELYNQVSAQPKAQEVKAETKEVKPAKPEVKAKKAEPKKTKKKK